MNQTSQDTAYQRIETALDRLERAIGQLSSPAPDGADGAAISREAYEDLQAANLLLRSRAEAAIEGINRLLGGEKAD